MEWIQPTEDQNERRTRIRKLIDTLGLTKVSSCRVGEAQLPSTPKNPLLDSTQRAGDSRMRSGISGGERKRLSIALEMV